MDKEREVREYVRALRSYYTNLVIYGGVSGACIIIWLLNGAGAFWPIWPIMGFVIAAVLQGMRLGTLKALEGWFPFLSPEWEEEQIKTMLKGGGSPKVIKEKTAGKSAGKLTEKSAAPDV
jgi:hypothetical protein